jgi:hypothetical protein
VSAGRTSRSVPSWKDSCQALPGSVSQAVVCGGGGPSARRHSQREIISIPDTDYPVAAREAKGRIRSRTTWWQAERTYAIRPHDQATHGRGVRHGRTPHTEHRTGARRRRSGSIGHFVAGQHGDRLSGRMRYAPTARPPRSGPVRHGRTLNSEHRTASAEITHHGAWAGA